ncbi:hypothetical protein COV16_03415 [Candidatus Woesearchaeota archaeon CG10_big_fil_rev_8_21_14_0_10_34_8]|nr:MAG: hypothetical protein COV16_03415 [Candidatus Woesearchaeota archaeon CG10_big_fil_rev_8_21_14_0_10_34_8]
MIISIHSPKTGGMSFREILEQSWPNKIFYVYGIKPSEPGALNRIKGYFKVYKFRKEIKKTAQNNSFKCIHGHFFADTFDTVIENRQYSMWFRSPVQLVISKYYFYQRYNWQDNYFNKLFQKKKISIEEFSSFPTMQNSQKRFLSTKKISDLDFIGITEEYDKSIKLFCKIFKVKNSFRIPKVNTNPRKRNVIQVYTPDQKVYNVLEENNKDDMIIYKNACNRFKELCKMHQIK